MKKTDKEIIGIIINHIVNVQPGDSSKINDEEALKNMIMRDLQQLTDEGIKGKSVAILREMYPEISDDLFDKETMKNRENILFYDKTSADPFKPLDDLLMKLKSLAQDKVSQDELDAAVYSAIENENKRILNDNNQDKIFNEMLEKIENVAIDNKTERKNPYFEKQEDGKYSLNPRGTKELNSRVCTALNIPNNDAVNSFITGFITEFVEKINMQKTSEIINQQIQGKLDANEQKIRDQFNKILLNTNYNNHTFKEFKNGKVFTKVVRRMETKDDNKLPLSALKSFIYKAIECKQNVRIDCIIAPLIQKLVEEKGMTIDQKDSIRINDVTEEKLQAIKQDIATDKILTIFNNLISEKAIQDNMGGDNGARYHGLKNYNSVGKIRNKAKDDFVTQVKESLSISADKQDDNLKFLFDKLNDLAGDANSKWSALTPLTERQPKTLTKKDLDVGAWDIIKAVLMVVFLPITIIPMVVNVATGSDVCNVQTKMKLNSKVGTLLEKREQNKDSTPSIK